jgi:plastocyanin
MSADTPRNAERFANRSDRTHPLARRRIRSRPTDAFNAKANGKSTTSLRAPTAPGRYSFFCAIHPEMKGTLTVK